MTYIAYKWIIVDMAMAGSRGTCATNLNTHTTGLLKKMDGIWNRNNLKSTGQIYTFAS